MVCLQIGQLRTIEIVHFDIPCKFTRCCWDFVTNVNYDCYLLFVDKPINSHTKSMIVLEVSDVNYEQGIVKFVFDLSFILSVHIPYADKTTSIIAERRHLVIRKEKDFFYFFMLLLRRA